MAKPSSRSSSSAPSARSPLKPTASPGRDGALKTGSGVRGWGRRTAGLTASSSSSSLGTEASSAEEELARLRAVCAQQAASLEEKEAQLRSLRGVEAPLDEACRLQKQLSDAATGEMQPHLPGAPGAVSVGDEQPSWLPRLLAALPRLGRGESGGRAGGGETDSMRDSSLSGSVTSPASTESTAPLIKSGAQPMGVSRARRETWAAMPPMNPPATRRFSTSAATRAAIAHASTEAKRRSASRRSSTPSRPRGTPAGRLKPYELRVHGLGWLSKFPKGGLTGHWNRRVFALIGCSLFYAKSVNDIVLSPKVFLELDPHSEVGPWRATGAPGRYTFSVTTGRGEVVLLAADSEEDRTEWSARLGRARREPACDVSNVAALIHYAIGSDCLFQQVLLSKADNQFADAHRGAYDTPSPRRRDAPPSFDVVHASARSAPIVDDRWPLTRWLERCLPEFVREFR